MPVAKPKPDDKRYKAGLPAHFTPLKSSNLEAMNIVASQEDPEVVQLQLIFKNRTRYHYSHIPLEMAEGLRTAESAGKYLNQVIKPYTETTVEFEARGLAVPIVERVDLITGESLVDEEEEQG